MNGDVQSGRPMKRLRFLLTRGLSPERKRLLASVSNVTFLPMEAVGEKGDLNTSDVRNITEIGNGYTLFFDGDVLVAKITPCFENGKGALVCGMESGVGFGSTEFHVLMPSADLDPRFLYYVSVSDSFRKRGEAWMTGAAGQKRVPESFVDDYLVPLFDRDHQREIAHFLDRETTRLDELIAAKQRMLGLLEEKRRALITRAVTRGIDPDVQMRDSGVSWLGEVPAHWDVERLKFSLHSLEQGWSPQCDNIPAEMGEWGVLKAGCVNGWTFNPTENKRLPERVGPLTRFEVRQGDVLMSRANTTALLGSTALVGQVRSQLLVCDKLYRLGIDETRLSKAFFVALSQTRVCRYQFEREATGTSGSMQNIGQDVVRNLLLPLPPRNEQDRIITWIGSETAKLDTVRSATERTISLICERRSALIAAAVTGQLSVRKGTKG